MRWPQPKRMLTRKKREEILREVHCNLFILSARHAYVDVLTDSGTGRMSEAQWKALEGADESYAGSPSSERLKDTIRDFFGVPHPLLVNQGRVAENVFGHVMQKEPGLVVAGNTPFDTTRINIEDRGGIIIDATDQMPIPPMEQLGEYPDFLGNVDPEKLRIALDTAYRGEKQVAYILVTATCNSNAGQPVSLENLHEICEVADWFDVPVYLDYARYAENAFFVKQREAKYSHLTVHEIIKEFVKPVDGLLASGKKDALANIGGFLGLKSEELAQAVAKQIRQRVGLESVEGAGYGGMSGRDIEALRQGILESANEEYLASRIMQVENFARELFELGTPILPPGGHAVFVDAGKLLPHLSWNEFPGHALALALWLEGGVRSVEIGSLMLGPDPETGELRQAPQELVRLAIPRRLYSDDQLQHVVDVFKSLKDKFHRISPVSVDPANAWEPWHFAAHFKWDGFR